jgi:hypothetical protein
VSGIRNADFSVLICVVSHALQSPVSLNIHNRCQDINLTSPVYFICGGGWNVAPEQEIDVNAVMSNRLEFDSGQDVLEGALVYRVQRKHAESAQDGTRHIQLLVAWHVDHTEGLYVRELLVEHDRELDEDKLMKLHQKCWQSLNALVSPIGCNWLLNDAMVLTATIKAMNGGCRWDIFISEGESDSIKRPLWIDTDR